LGRGPTGAQEPQTRMTATAAVTPSESSLDLEATTP
jgi:hypothetical protein